MTKQIVLTGATSGIGSATAKLFASNGFKLILTGRTLEKAKEFKKDVKAEKGLTSLALDLSDIGSVKAAADYSSQLLKTSKEAVIVHNAGALLKKRLATKDGFEQSLQVNYLSPVLFSALVMKSQPSCHFRHVFVSAGVYRSAKVQWDDLQFEKGVFNGWAAYCQAKKLQVLLSRFLIDQQNKQSLAEVLGVSKLNFETACLDPGWIKTNLVRPEHGWNDKDYEKMMGGAKTTEEEAARTISYAAISDQVRDGDFVAKEKVQRIHNSVDVKEDQEKLWSYTKEFLNKYMS